MTFHEFGHFYIARRCGVKVLRFSVGFGKPLFHWVDKFGTEFVIATVPLGGFVKMLDEREGEVLPEELPQAFSQKSVWQRMAIVVAGPVANFLLAIVFYFIVALLGIKGVAPVIGAIEEGSVAANAGFEANHEIVAIDGKPTPTWALVFEQFISRIGDTGAIEIDVRPYSPQSNGLDLTSTKIVEINQWLGHSERPDALGDLGIKPLQPKTDWVITALVDGGAAKKVGLQVGDKLLSSNQEPLTSWQEWVEWVRSSPGEPLELEVLRGEARLFFTVVPQVVEENGENLGRVGIATSVTWPDHLMREQNYSLLQGVVYGLNKTWEQTLVVLSFLKRLILLDISIKNMGGSFTIAQVAGDSAESGISDYLKFLAQLSVTLAVFNLLPIPVLDGGHLLFYVIEAIKGKPLSESIQMLGYQVGLLIIISVMIIAHYNDLVRLFS